MTTYITLEGDINDLTDGEFDTRRTKVTLIANTTYIVDADTSTVHLGTRAHINSAGKHETESDGTFSFTNVIAETALVDNLQYTVRIDYPQRYPRGNSNPVETFGPYDLSAETGTVNLAALEAVQALDPTYASEFMTQAQELLDAQIAISGIDDTDSAVAALIEDELVGPLTTAALSASYVATVKAATGVAATDVANIQAAETALPAAGGLIQLRAGTYNLGTTGLTFTKPSVVLAGAGGMMNGDGVLAADDKAATTLEFSSATGNAITFSAPGFVARDFAVINTAGSTPTAGVGIRASSASQSKIHRVTVIGFYDDIHMLNGQYWSVTDCFIYDPVRYGIFIDNGTTGLYDHGAFSVINNVFTNMWKVRNANAAIRWISGGGGRFIGNQINGGAVWGNSGAAANFQVGIDLAVRDSVATGDFQITANDINNVSVACIRLGTENRTAPASNTMILNTTIVGNTLNAAAPAIGVQVDTVSFSYVSTIRQLTINSNQFATLTNSVVANWMRGLHIGSNHHSNISGAVIKLGPGAGTYNIGVEGVHVEDQFVAEQVPSAAMTLFEDWRSINNTAGQGGTVKHRYRKQAYITTKNVWNTVFTVGVYPFKGAGKITVRLAGANGATGPVFIEAERAWHTPTNNAAPTLVTVGTDTDVGVGEGAVQVVSTANTLTVQIQVPNAAADSNFTGHVEIEIVGNVASVARSA